MGRDPCHSQPAPNPTPLSDSECCRIDTTRTESDREWEPIRNISPASLKMLRQAKRLNQPVIGFSCPMTPVELILAAGGIAVDVSGDSPQAVRASRNCLPDAACALVCSTCGGHVLENNPLLEMTELVIGEVGCDSRKSLYRHMDASRPVYMLRPPGPLDENEVRERWACEVRKLCVMLEKRFERPITDDNLVDAIRLMNRQRALYRELAGLLREPSPPLTGVQMMEVGCRVPAMPMFLDAMKSLIEHLRGQPRDPALASRVRVLVTGSPLNQQALRVVRAIEQNGGLIVGYENCTGYWRDEPDIPIDTKDALQAIADRYFYWPCLRAADSGRRKHALAELIGTRRVDAIVEIAWQTCPTFERRAEIDAGWIPATFHLPYQCVRPHFAPREKAAMVVDIAGFLQQASPSLARAQ